MQDALSRLQGAAMQPAMQRQGLMQPPQMRHCLVLADARQPDFLARCCACAGPLWRCTSLGHHITCCLYPGQPGTSPSFKAESSCMHQSAWQPLANEAPCHTLQAVVATASALWQLRCPASWRPLHRPCTRGQMPLLKLHGHAVRSRRCGQHAPFWVSRRASQSPSALRQPALRLPRTVVLLLQTCLPAMGLLR